MSIIVAPACNLSVVAQYSVPGLPSACCGGDTRVMSRTHQDALTSSEDVLSVLRSDILSLTLRPGQRLTTEFLSARYDLGASPLREALSSLVGEGLVVRESNRGFSVSPMSRRELDDLIASRLLLEPTLLALAIESGGDAWESHIISTLKDLQPSLQKVGDSRPLDRAWEEKHRLFHFALMALDDGSLMMAFCKILYDRYDRYRLLGIPRRAYLAGVAGDHEDLADAAIARKSELAIEILSRHITDTSHAVAANIEAAGLTRADGMIEIPPSGIDFA